jgi:hypothetical protein
MKDAGETRGLPDGYAVRFPSDPTLFVKVAEWITLERLCCSFLAFGLDWSERDGCDVGADRPLFLPGLSSERTYGSATSCSDRPPG